MNEDNMDFSAWSDKQQKVWQPIETAPKYELISFYVPTAKKHKIVTGVVKQSCYESVWSGTNIYLHNQDRNGKTIYATHWMPLPDAPQ